MEQKYSDAFKSGLKFGIVIVVIYLVVGLIAAGLNHTSSMVAYKDELTRYDQELLNQTHSSSGGAPYVYSHPMPRPPVTYYLVTACSLILYAVMIIGLLAAGVFTIRKGNLSKYSLKDSAYIGGFAGLGSFVPLFLGIIVLSLINFAINGSAINTLAGILPAEYSSFLVAIYAIEAVCCCLPFGIVASAVLGSIGAVAYVALTGKLESKGTQV